MNIFLIGLVVTLLSFLITLIAVLICCQYWEENWIDFWEERDQKQREKKLKKQRQKKVLSYIIILVLGFLLWIGGGLIGIGINTNQERIFAYKFEIQKQTIEESMNCDDLTGLERIELVKTATELNGEFAERKARMRLWYFVVYDKTIYDEIQPIRLNK